jgi:hypothetical protein
MIGIAGNQWNTFFGVWLLAVGYWLLAVDG